MTHLTRSIALAFAATGLIGTSVAVAGPSGLQVLPTKASIQIRHQVKGCHAWSLNGGPFQAAQAVRLAAGAKLTITDNDVMTHQLVRTSGPRATFTLVVPGAASTGTLKAPYAAGMMPHTGATLRVSFPSKGVYTFMTKAGEDYMKGVTTTGPDNMLRLTVTVA
jgi:hypothetical protein